MMMLAVCALTAVVMAAQSAASKKELSPEEKEARKLRMMQKTGGILKVPGAGKVVILNGQKKVPASRIASDAAVIARAIRAEVQVKDCEETFTVANAPALLKKSGGNAMVFITDDPALPMSLVAIEANWGVMNIAPLSAGNPTPEKLAARSSRELLRTTTVTLGGALSSNQASAMQTVQNVEDLDKIVSDGIAFDALRNMLTHLPKIGVTPPRMSTYRKACQEGWAQPPTNEFQKVIWEEIRSQKERGPSKPLVIVPPKK